MDHLGKIVLSIGVILSIVGIALIAAPKIPFLGKLPGDITIKKENYVVYIPLATCLLISIIVSAIFWLISFLGKK
ncbi:MAG TPA: DUF2905 domain-containing protein [Bacteroidota bacterium]|nr:DUF2905 domain-containing protein [Bacteroidota bacterium]